MTKRSVCGAEKKPGDELFETMGAQDLNGRLQKLMDGLSVKVFRTYNASITLDRELHRESTSTAVDEKKADYDCANREVLNPYLVFFWGEESPQKGFKKRFTFGPAKQGWLREEE